MTMVTINDRNQRGIMFKKLQKRRAYSVLLAVLLASGVAARLFLIFFSPDLGNSGPDSPSYAASMEAMLSQGWTVDTQELRVFPWGYAAFLASIGALLSPWNYLLAPLLLQVGLFAVSTAVLAAAIRKLWGSTVALVTAGILALSPSAIDVTASVMYEGLIISLVALAMAATINILIHEDSKPWWIATFVACQGFIVFIHPRMFVYVLISVVFLFIQRRMLPAILALLLSVMAYATLALRSWLSLGSWSISANQGGNIVIGLPYAGFKECSSRVYEPPAYGTASMEGDAALLECGVNWILNNPVEWISISPVKVAEYLGPWTLRAIGRSSSLTPEQVAADDPLVGTGFSSSAVQIVVSLFTLIAILLGFYFTRTHRNLLTYALVQVSAGIGLAILFYGYARFRMPLYPFQTLFWALVVGALWRILQARRSEQPDRVSNGM